jgi:hypothetical protein
MIQSILSLFWLGTTQFTTGHIFIPISDPSRVPFHSALAERKTIAEQTTGLLMNNALNQSRSLFHL